MTGGEVRTVRRGPIAAVTVVVDEREHLLPCSRTRALRGVARVWAHPWRAYRVQCDLITAFAAVTLPREASGRPALRLVE